jgi:outer membrane protein TolC
MMGATRASFACLCIAGAILGAPVLATAADSGPNAQIGTTSTGAPVTLPPINVRPIEAGLRLPIDLPIALRLAGARNLDLRQAELQMAEANAKSEAALGALVPEPYGSVLAFGQKTSGQTLGFFTALGRNSFDTINAMSGAQLSTNPAQAIFAALAAHRLVDAARADLEEVTQQVLAQAAIGYFALEESAANFAIAEQELAASRELARVAATRYSLGRGLKVDTKQADARVAADQVALSRAAEDFRKASVELAVTLKLDPKVTLFPLDRVVRQRTLADSQLTLDQEIERAIAARPALTAEAERVVAAEHSRSAAWSGALAPSIYTNLQDNSVGPVGNHQFYAGAIGLRFSFTSLGAARLASVEMERERIERERLREQVQAQVVLAHDNVTTAAEQVESARQGLAAAQSAFELSRDRFQGGVGLELEVLDAQAALQRARTDLISALVGYNQAQVTLLQALGALTAAALLK